jgi:4-hydroxyphenylpyruvate dioxygenase
VTLGVFYERTADGEHLHAYTELLGGAVFPALVGRTGSCAGEGTSDTPGRMAAHRRARLPRDVRTQLPRT